MGSARRFFRPYLVAILALFITLIGWFFTKSSVDLYNSARFYKLSNDIENDLSLRLKTYINSLSQTQGMVAVTPYLSRKVFKEYFSYINFKDQFHGLKAMGMMEKLLAVDLKTHISHTKSEGFPDYRIHPFGKKAEYFPIINIEPFSGENKNFLGYDMSSEATLQEAMHRARDTNSPAMSGKVILNGRPSFVILVPIYKNQAKVKTLLQRRKNLVGYVFNSYETAPFFSSIFSKIKTSFPLDFEVYLGKDLNADTLIYDHDENPFYSLKNYVPEYLKKRTLIHGGMNWTIVTYSLPIFDVKSYTFIPYIVLVVGVFFAIFLYWTMNNFMKQSIREKELYQKAQDAIASRDEFISIASHELKTPLATMKLQVQSFDRNLKRGNVKELTEEKLDRVTVMLNKQISRLTDLVDNLLDVSRAGAGRLTLSKSEVDISSIIKEIVERHQNGTFLTFESPESIHGNFDRLRIEQITENLVSNALKYAPLRPVEVSLHALEGKVILKVKDHGPGISLENQKRIFDRFERINTSSRVSGLGLGLYITKQIVEAHGGEIRVESDLGVGTTFTVILPIEEKTSDNVINLRKREADLVNQ